METAFITKCDYKNEWSTDKGTFHTHILNLDNGIEAEINAKEKLPSKLAVGQKLFYEVTTPAKGAYPAKIKAVQDPNANTNGYKPFDKGKGKPQQDEAAKLAGMFISYAKDLVIAGSSPTLDAALKDIEFSFNGLYDRLKLKMQ